MSKHLLATSISILTLACVVGDAHATGWKLRDPDINTVVNSDNRNANHNLNANKANSNAHSNAHAGAAASNKNANIAANRNANHNAAVNHGNGGRANASNKNANIAANHNHNNVSNRASGGHANAVGKGGDARAQVHNNNHVEGSRSYASSGDVTSVNKISNGSRSNAANKNNIDVSPTTNVDAGSSNTIDSSSNNTIDTGSNNTIDAASNNTNNIDAATTNDVSSSAANDASNNNSTTFNGGDTNIEAIALDYDAIDLANLPVAVCQGSSVTASGSGNDGLFGIGLGFGKSNIDDQCTLRENIRAVATLAEHVPQLRHDVLQAVAHLDGFEHLWPQGQHPKCPKWIKKGSKKALKHNCRFPEVGMSAHGAKATAVAAPAPLAIDPQNYIVYFDFDKSKLTDAGKDVISDAAAAILRHDAQVVVISGHTDRAGDAQYNERLSERRAKTVRKALVAKGVSEDIIRTGSFGETQPASPTADGVANPLNRRAEVVIRFVPHSDPRS